MVPVGVRRERELCQRSPWARFSPMSDAPVSAVIPGIVSLPKKNLSMCETLKNGSTRNFCYNLLWLMDSWKESILQKIYKLKNVCFRISAMFQKCITALSWIDAFHWSHPLLDRKWNNKKNTNPKPFLQSQMGVIMSVFPFRDVWLLTFGRELRNCSWYGSYDSTDADSKHLIKSQVGKVIIY